LDGVSLTRINLALETVRRILSLAARARRRRNRLTRLQTTPLITIERNRAARKGYALSWEEQDLLLGELPDLNRAVASSRSIPEREPRKSVRCSGRGS
jgi:hypothetical protein